MYVNTMFKTLLRRQTYVLSYKQLKKNPSSPFIDVHLSRHRCRSFSDAGVYGGIEVIAM